MSVEQQLRSLSGTGGRPNWAAIEDRAAELRERRHRTRGGVALAVLVAGLALFFAMRGDPSTTQTVGPVGPDAPQDSETAPDVDGSAPATSAPVTTTTPDDPACAGPSGADPATLERLRLQLGSDRVATIPFPPDCSVTAFVDATKLTAEYHEPVPVYDRDAEQIGVLVYGLPAMTVEEYERDPEGHRLAGIARSEDFSTLGPDVTEDE